MNGFYNNINGYPVLNSQWDSSFEHKIWKHREAANKFMVLIGERKPPGFLVDFLGKFTGIIKVASIIAGTASAHPEAGIAANRLVNSLNKSNSAFFKEFSNLVKSSINIAKQISGLTFVDNYQELSIKFHGLSFASRLWVRHFMMERWLNDIDSFRNLNFETVEGQKTIMTVYLFKDLVLRDEQMSFKGVSMLGSDSLPLEERLLRNEFVDDPRFKRFYKMHIKPNFHISLENNFEAILPVLSVSSITTNKVEFDNYLKNLNDSRANKDVKKPENLVDSAKFGNLLVMFGLLSTLFLKKS